MCKHSRNSFDVKLVNSDVGMAVAWALTKIEPLFPPPCISSTNVSKKILPGSQIKKLHIRPTWLIESQNFGKTVKTLQMKVTKV